MADFYMSAESIEGRRLTIAPMTTTKLARCVDAPDDISGYFLTEECLTDPMGEVVILARIDNSDAAFRLWNMFAKA